MTLQIFWPKPGNPREGGQKGGTNGREGGGEGGSRAKPGNQLVILYNNLRVEIWLAMIIRFQLGNLCMRNKGTLFRAQIIPTYHQTPIMCYQKPLLL